MHSPSLDSNTSPSLDSNTGFLSRSKPEGTANSDEADAKERRTVVQVIDDSTDTALPVEHEVSSNVPTRRVEDLALRSTNLKHRVFNNDAVVNVRTPSLEPTGLKSHFLGIEGGRQGRAYSNHNHQGQGIGCWQCGLHGGGQENCRHQLY